MDANRLPPLGWPWDALADAVLAAEDARKRLHAAQVVFGIACARVKAGEPAQAELSQAIDERNRAELDLETALVDHHTVRDEMSRQWLAGLRAVLDLEPTALAGLLGDLPVAPAVAEALGELEDRIDAAEDAVVNLEQGRVPV